METLSYDYLEPSSHPPYPSNTVVLTFDLRLGSLLTSVTQIPNCLHQERNALAKVWNSLHWWSELYPGVGCSSVSKHYLETTKEAAIPDPLAWNRKDHTIFESRKSKKIKEGPKNIKAKVKVKVNVKEEKKPKERKRNESRSSGNEENNPVTDSFNSPLGSQLDDYVCMLHPKLKVLRSIFHTSSLPSIHLYCCSTLHTIFTQ